MRWLFFVPAVFLFYAGICFYIGRHLFDFFYFLIPNLKTLIFWIVFACLCLLLIFAGFLQHRLNFIRIAGLYWMALILYLPVLFVISDLFRLFLFIIGKKLPNINFYTAAVSLFICLLLFIYGTFHARSIKTVNYDISLSGSTDIRIALISDLHIGSTVGSKWIGKIVQTVNEAQPDIVFIAGDVFDGNVSGLRNTDKIINELRKIKSPLGVYACLGNHDVDRMDLNGGGTKKIEEILESANIILLQDEVMRIKENIFIAGRRDARPIGMKAERKTTQELLAGIDGTVIVLDHQPVEFAALEKAGASLVLSGHTHRGQIFPASLFTRIIFKRAGAAHYGYWQGSSMQGIITSGAGVWGPPLRIGTNSEAAVINIKRRE